MEGRAPRIKTGGAGLVAEGVAQLGTVHGAVAVFVHDMLHGAALGLRAVLLLLGGPAEHQHHRWEHIVRQVQQTALGVAVFHDIADVARADAKAFGGHHGVLGGNGGVGDSQHQIAHARRAGRAARFLVGVVPLAAVGAEHQHQRGLGNERLMVAAVGQRGLQGRVGDVQNGVQLLAARRGGLRGSFQNGLLHSDRDGFFFKHPHRLAGIQALQDGIGFGHGEYLLKLPQSRLTPCQLPQGGSL